MTLPLNRREVILAATMTALELSLLAAAPVPVPAADIGGNTIPLWPEGAPGGARVTAREEILERAPEGPLRDRIARHVRRPVMTMFGPRTQPNGITLLIIPGGGYVRVVIDKEGVESAEWFAERGFTAALLRYRLPGDGWAAGADAPVHDAMRAVKLLRNLPSTAGASTQRVGVLGFSAGGHVAARLITEHASLSYARVDDADSQVARPDFASLMYPVIKMTGPAAHGGSRDELLKAGVDESALSRFEPSSHVDESTPRCQILHAADDDAVPVANSQILYDALREAGVRAELHLFDRGGHGFGLRGTPGRSIAAWPTLVEHWAKSG
jgi:acetyl esterase/lipase